MPNHEIEFADDGTCDVHVQALLEGGGTGLIHRMRLDDTIGEIEIELVNTSKGPATYYTATLTDVKVAKVASRSVWGGAFDEVDLLPAQVRLEQRRMKPDGSLEPAGQVQVTCGSSRVP